MPFLPRTSFAEKKRISVIAAAPEVATFDNLAAVCLGYSTYKFPIHTEGVKFNEVYAGLYIGEGPLNAQKLQSLGVVRVLELGAARNILVTDKCRNPYKDEGIKFMALKIEDSESARLNCYFEECAKFIERGLKHGAVYVYSPNGRSRSATVLAAFLMMRKGMSGVDALRAIHIRKPVRPNDGFLRQLALLEADIRASDNKLQGHLEVRMDCECVKKKPLYAPYVHFRDANNYNLKVLGLNRQKVAQRLYLQEEDPAANPITHTEKGAVKSIIFKAL